MFTGITGRRVVEMTAQETRWLENVRKAFYASDQAICARTPQEACLESLVKAIDIAKTLRRSLRGESVDHYENRKRFTHFLELEVPAPDAGGREALPFNCDVIPSPFCRVKILVLMHPNTTDSVHKLRK